MNWIPGLLILMTIAWLISELAKYKGGGNS